MITDVETVIQARIQTGIEATEWKDYTLVTKIFGHFSVVCSA
jgi:hypothetical protein